MRSRLFRSSNPMFRGNQYELAGVGESASYAGIVTKTAFLFLGLIASILTVQQYPEYFYNNVGILFGALIGGFIAVLVARFNPRAAKFAAPIYAILEGVVLGVIVMTYNLFYPGIVQTAVLITLSIFGAMLLLYGTGVIRVGSFLRRIVYSALMGLVFFSVALMIMSLFGSSLASAFFGNLQFMLMFSLISAVVASLLILIDLDNCSRIVNAGVHKDYEWMASLGLMVTLIWLFLEVLRILAIFASRRD